MIVFLMPYGTRDHVAFVKLYLEKQCGDWRDMRIMHHTFIDGISCTHYVIGMIQG